MQPVFIFISSFFQSLEIKVTLTKNYNDSAHIYMCLAYSNPLFSKLDKLIFSNISVYLRSPIYFISFVSRL